MDIKDKVTQLIFDSIDLLNEQLPANNPIEKSVDKMLIGVSGQLDSLGVVNLSVIIEEKVENSFGLEMSFIDDHAMSKETHPLTSIETLQSYLTELLEEHGIT